MHISTLRKAYTEVPVLTYTYSLLTFLQVQGRHPRISYLKEYVLVVMQGGRELGQEKKRETRKKKKLSQKTKRQIVERRK